MKITSQGVIGFVLGGVFAFVVAGGLAFVVGIARDPNPPQLAGQHAPDRRITIDFDARYDAYCRFDDNAASTRCALR